METIQACLVEDCNNLSGARGLCKKHYKRWQRHGNVDYNSRPKVKGVKDNKDHPLYKKWRSITRREVGDGVCERWRSFQNFVDDVKEIPAGLFFFKKKNPELPFGPENYFWSDSLRSLKNQSRRSKPGPMPKSEFLEKQEILNLPGRKNHKNNIKSLNRRSRSLIKKYGMTLDQYEERVLSQNGVCAICKKPETIFNGNLAVDHCHTSGKVRGLLCSKCNTMLGNVGDSTAILESAIDYLNFHSQA